MHFLCFHTRLSLCVALHEISSYYAESEQQTSEPIKHMFKEVNS